MILCVRPLPTAVGVLVSNNRYNYHIIYEA